MQTISNYIEKTDNKQHSIIDYFIVFWMIYASGIITFQYNNFMFLMVGTIIATACVWFGNINVALKSKSVILLFLLLEYIALSHLIISVVDGHIYFGSLKMLLMFLFVFLCCLKFSMKKFFRIFSNIIVFVAAISIVLYWFNSAIVSSGIFPILKTDEFTTYVNLYVYCINTAIMHRNCGVFWEPGAFQIYLNLSLLYVLHDETVRKRKIKIAVLVIAILTTISTTGYICLALILAAYFLKSNMKSKFKMLFFALAVLLAIGGGILPIVMESFAYKFGLSTGEMSQNVTSRVNPFLLDLRLILNNPLGLFGVDYYAERLMEYSNIYSLPYVSSSCTVTMVAVVYGLIPGLLLLYGILSINRKFFDKKVRWFLIILLLIMFTTESFLVFPFYYFLSFMGYKEKE